MRASAAYPRMASRSYVKYISMGALAALVVFLFLSDTGSISGNSRVGMPEPNIRAPFGYVKLSQLLGVGLGLTSTAAKVIKEVKKSKKEDLKVKGYTKEGAAEPVTVADTSSNKVFVNGYRNHFGDGTPILSEETEPEKDPIMVNSPELPEDLQAKLNELDQDHTLDLSQVLIIVDPLDATKEFSENLLEYVTTMVCIVYQGKPIAGIINQVFEDKPPVVGIAPSAPHENGILYNREKQGPVDEEAAHMVTISRSHTGEGGNVVEKYLDNHTVRFDGGAGFKSLLVLDGQAEAYIHVTAIKSWDVCAAEAIMKASGGGFTDIEGKALEYSSEYSRAKFTNGIIASGSGDQHAWFVNALDGRLS